MVGNLRFSRTSSFSKESFPHLQGRRRLHGMRRATKLSGHCGGRQLLFPTSIVLSIGPQLDPSCSEIHRSRAVGAQFSYGCRVTLSLVQASEYPDKFDPQSSRHPRPAQQDRQSPAPPAAGSGTRPTVIAAKTKRTAAPTSDSRRLN